MALRIIILGDIVGTAGRLAVAQALPKLRQQHRPHLVIANAENAAAGSGLTPELYGKLSAAGIDAMTLGDHAFRKRQIKATLESQPNIIRPANISAKAIGRGVMLLQPAPLDSREPAALPKVAVVTVLGRLFMTNMPANDPFAAVDRVIETLDPGTVLVVEIHAEASSEKIAMGWHANGKAAVVFGTHTHVATADARLLPTHYEPDSPTLPRSTAFISDLGMCGPHDSVLGRRVDRVLKFMTTNTPAPFDVAEGNPRVNGIVVHIDPDSRLATHIERIELAANVNQPPFVNR